MSHWLATGRDLPAGPYANGHAVDPCLVRAEQLAGEGATVPWAGEAVRDGLRCDLEPGSGGGGTWSPQH